MRCQTVTSASLNGDYNPLHADPAVGKSMGFGGVILHGLCTWNMACQAILSTFAVRFRLGRQLAASAAAGRVWSWESSAVSI